MTKGLPVIPLYTDAFSLCFFPASPFCPADGNSDEIDEPIKALFADEDFARAHGLTSLNSINWSRILVQIAHYFYAYFRCAPCRATMPLPVVEIVVPTGGGGNLTGW